MNLLTRITRSLSVLVVTACTSMVFAADDELWYPRTLQSEKGSAVIYAPQIDNWDNFETIKAWTAFSITTAGSEESWYGSMRFTARTDTDIAAREVLLHDVEVLELSIDGLAEDSEEYALIHDGFTSMSRKVPLDLVLAYLPRSVPLDTTEGLNTEPPQIFVSDSPAILLFIDGEPRFLPVDGSGLQFVLNTPWDVLREGEDGPLYLCHDDAWLSSSALDAKWQWATRLPANLDKLPHGPNWDRLRDCLPEQLDKLSEPEATPPIVYYSTEAAELLLTDGEPRWAAIGDRGLNYATNTEQELFRVDDIYFLLLSGRWFSTAQLDGPWALARQLPDAFQDIPPEDSAQAHEMSYVRSSIPGTEEAWEAALLASIPRKAEIQRGSEDTLDIAVSYAGEPVFAPIEETGIDLAVNTSYQVLRYEGVYFLCHNATWLTAPSASGPWKFADSIPDVFATIPPSSPAYNTTFVKIDGSNEESIYYAYKSGYDGAYVENETVVQGTGYAAPAVTVAFAYTYASGYPYPYYPYYWWPPTYGYGSWYNPNTGRYGEAVVGYGPYGAAGSAAFYNPETGVYGRNSQAAATLTIRIRIPAWREIATLTSTIMRAGASGLRGAATNGDTPRANGKMAECCPSSNRHAAQKAWLRASARAMRSSPRALSQVTIAPPSFRASSRTVISPAIFPDPKVARAPTIVSSRKARLRVEARIPRTAKRSKRTSRERRKACSESSKPAVAARASHSGAATAISSYTSRVPATYMRGETATSTRKRTMVGHK
jgi:hypothetical protein